MNGISPVVESPPLVNVGATLGTEADRSPPADSISRKLQRSREWHAKHPEYGRQWNLKNAEFLKEYRKKYNQLDRVRQKDRARDKLEHRKARKRGPKNAEKCKKWREQNKESLRAIRKQFYQKNHQRLLEWKRNHPPDKERRRKYSKAWLARNYCKTVKYRMKRKLQIKATIVREDLINDFIARVRAKRLVRCYYCRASFTGKAAEIDHIIALSKGGEHRIENLCVSCETCNRRKHARPISEFYSVSQPVLNL